jgi:hypothetical protein
MKIGVTKTSRETFEVEAHKITIQVLIQTMAVAEK